MHIILNHTLVQAENAVIPVTDRGFRYGDGAFETIAVHCGVPYRLGFHLKRLAHGLEAIRLKADLSKLEEECHTLLTANKVENGLLRIQITRGSGGRGYLPDDSAAPTYVIETFPLPKIPSKPVTLYGSSYAKIPAIALPTEKLCQGVNSTLARMEAADYGCFEALMLDMKGHIAGVSSGNIFWLKENTLYTPALDCGAMAGSTRAAILELTDMKVEEVHAMPPQLAEAEAVFITNVSWIALPVAELKPAGWQWQSEETALRMRQLIVEDRKRQREKAA